ncbi:MAG: hypothetical protein RMK49_18760, partial [Abditibacteriales bacterium]|nr:hypothetical protein [Abditibacteriales bacterium]
PPPYPLALSVGGRSRVACWDARPDGGLAGTPAPTIGLAGTHRPDGGLAGTLAPTRPYRRAGRDARPYFVARDRDQRIDAHSTIGFYPPRAAGCLSGLRGNFWSRMAAL